MAVVAKRSIMTLFSGPLDLYSHRVRIVLAEKGVSVDIIDVDPDDKPEELLELNPYNSVPTLVDRDLVLYKSDIITEYLDERFPHPPLMPVYPVVRAKCRLMMYRISRDWYSLVHEIEKTADGAEKKRLQQQLGQSLASVAPIFDEMPYFFSQEFTLVDCFLAPMLWRLPSLGVEIPSSGRAVLEYAERLFERDSFKASLSEAERELRDNERVNA